MIYSYYCTENDKIITLPNGEKIEKESNAIEIKFNSNSDYVGYEFNTYTEPTQPIEEPTVDESSTPSEETLQRGDINGDGKINVLDLLQLKKYILKIVDTLD